MCVCLPTPSPSSSPPSFLASFLSQLCDTHYDNTTLNPTIHIFCSGKIQRKDDGTSHPEVTAARELEEESHGLIRAADSLAVLQQCPVMYCHSSKMVVYLMRYCGGKHLPDLLQQLLAGEKGGGGC